MQENIIELFFSLIRCGIGKENALPRIPTPQEWDELFNLAKKQTLAGIAFAGIERLPKEQHPPQEILLPWFSMSETIRQKNIEMNKKSIAVSRKFKEEGFKNCILKGQGIAQLYPDPSLRTPGDIDIWLDGKDKDIIEYVKKYLPDSHPTYHHVDFPIAKGLDIEIHYRPTWMYSPNVNKRLQAHFTACAQEQFSNKTKTPEGELHTPTTEFNRVYILLHIYRHLFFEGIGMRQILDYYFVTIQSITAREKREFIKTIKGLRLTKFTAALTYVMQQMFSLDQEHIIIQPDAKTGKFLLREIMIAGNFGKYDHRYNLGENKYSTRRAIEILRRSITLLTRYPSETLWSPYFKIWHYYWRKNHSK